MLRCILRFLFWLLASIQNSILLCFKVFSEDVRMSLCVDVIARQPRRGVMSLYSLMNGDVVSANGVEIMILKRMMTNSKHIFNMSFKYIIYNKKHRRVGKTFIL